MSKTVDLNGTKVVFTVKPGGSIRYDFEALSKAKRPVVYSFFGTIEAYQFDRSDEPTGYVNFSYAKRDGGGGFRFATWSARDRWQHVVRFIRSEVYPAAREYAKSEAYAADLVAAARDRLLSDVGEALRNYERAVRALNSAKDELAGAEARLASFDERHGTAPS